MGGQITGVPGGKPPWSGDTSAELGMVRGDSLV